MMTKKMRNNTRDSLQPLQLKNTTRIFEDNSGARPLFLLFFRKKFSILQKETKKRSQTKIVLKSPGSTTKKKTNNKKTELEDSRMRQLIIARKDLNMSAGKLAAQVSHASMAFLTAPLRNAEGEKDKIKKNKNGDNFVDFFAY